MRVLSTTSPGRRRAAVALAMGVAGVLALTSCSSTPAAEPSGAAPAEQTWEEVVAAAEEEGELTLYTSTSQHLIDKLVPAFEATYDIKINLNRIGQTSDMIERLENEVASNSYQADVVNHIDGRHVNDLKARGYINTDPQLPAAEEWPSEYYSEGVGQTQLTVYTILYNTDLVSAEEAPQDWEDLLDPKWKGKIGALDPFQAGYVSGYQMLQEKYGDQFLEDFGAQDIKWWDSGNPLAEAVAAGELPIAVFTYVHKSADLKKAGAPVEWVDLPTSSGWKNYIWATATEHSKNPNAAKVFLNWIMSPEGQLSYLGDGGGNSPLNLEGTLPLPQEMLLYETDELADNINVVRGLLGLSPV
jgi:iron(III) transport system substrate-binding protein